MTEREIFVAAFQRIDPVERGRYLADACGSDEALRRRVENLLGVAEGAGSFLESPAANIDTTIAQPPVEGEGPGTQVGPYKLVEVIGEGGMGVVYLAQQTEPVKRFVALKVIKAGMDSRQVLARFEAERQALALMDHPNIARVLDAGVAGVPASASAFVGVPALAGSSRPPEGGTPTKTASSGAFVGVPASAGVSEDRLKAGLQQEGRPYFVMELVKGVPITKFCDERKLTPRERLELFLPVCHAIQHAHQKGIIHRDIKPSNVMVALHDENPVPKVIDFGVAKAVGQQLTEKTLYTGFGTLIGTPSYMAPEQATFNQLDIDTRADIYSLGVLLYELLAGSPPFEPARLKTAALEEVLRLVREEEPPRPSQRLSTSEAKASIAAVRQSEPAKLRRLLRGELDWVVMKALEKDRSRRYETASGLALDVRRHLNHEPVQAHPPSRWYRLCKLAHRHRGVLAAAALLGLSLFATIAVLVIGRGQILAEQTVTKQALANERNANQALQNAFVRERRHQNSLRVALAYRYWMSLDPARARELLEESPADLRDAEWHRLHRLCRAELVRIDLGGPGVGHSPVRFSPDGKHLVATIDSRSRVWDAATGRELFALAGNITRMSAFNFTPDGRHVIGIGPQAVRDDKPGRLFEVNTWELGERKLVKSRTHRWDSLPDRVQTSPDGRRAGTNTLKSFSMKDIDGGHELSTFELSDLWSPKIAYSADMSYVAGICGDFKHSWIQVWNTASGKIVHTIRDLPLPLVQVAVSGDGRRLVTICENTKAAQRRLFAWDAESKASRFIGHVKLNAAIAFSPGDRRIAVVDDDRVIRVWDVESRTEELTLRGHTGPFNSIAFSPDGLRLASSAADSTIRIWDVRPLESEVGSP